jgi:hypothetical protein
MVSSKKAVHRNSAGKIVKRAANVGSRIRSNASASRRRQSAAEQSAMLHNWLLETDTCSVNSD